MALFDLALVMAIGGQRLPEGEQVLSAPRSGQRLGDGLLVGLDAWVTELGQHLGPAFPVQDGVQDPQPRHPGDVADHVVDLQVHLGQGFVDVLHVGGSHLDQGRLVTQHRPHGRHSFGRVEGATQKPHGVEVLEPLAVQHVGLAAGHSPQVTGVDQAHLDPPLLEDREQRHPVHARGFHGHRGDPARRQPLGQLDQIRREGGKRTNRFGVPLSGYRDVDLPGPDVDSGRVGVDDCLRTGPRTLPLARSLALGHGTRSFPWVVDPWKRSVREGGPSRRLSKLF